MSESKRQEIIEWLIQNRPQPQKICMQIMDEYVFWPRGNNEHYSIDEINSMYEEIRNSLTPKEE